LKKLFITLLVCVTAFAANAQVGYNYMQYDFGLMAGTNTAHTDFQIPRTTYSFGATFTYNYTPYLNYIAEFQTGSIKADTLVEIPGYNFINNYTSITFRAQLQAGELIDYSQSKLYNALKNFYVSAGVGIIYSDLQVFNYDLLESETKSSNIFIPFKIGYEAKLFNSYNEPWAKIDVGYQLFYFMSDNLDGFTSGHYNDAYTQFSVGVKFGIGGRTSYRKAINY